MFAIKKEVKERPDTISAICTNCIRSFPVVKEYQGSFTVEAALIFPLIMLCFCLAIWTGIELQDEVKDKVETLAEKKPLDVISCMYRKEYLEKLLGEFYGD